MVQHILTQSVNVSLRPMLDGYCKMSRLDITGSYLTVNAGMKVLGDGVDVIFLAFIPVESNLFENLFVAKPMHVHVPRFVLLWLHAGIDKPISSGVVFLERIMRLLMTETYETEGLRSGLRDLGLGSTQPCTIW